MIEKAGGFDNHTRRQAGAQIELTHAQLERAESLLAEWESCDGRLSNDPSAIAFLQALADLWGGALPTLWTEDSAPPDRISS